MQPVSVIAIFLLFWVLSAFVVLPLGIKNTDEMGQKRVPGQADGAPGNFRPLRVIGLTTVLAAALFGLFYLNYAYEWITVDDIDMFNSIERINNG